MSPDWDIIDEEHGHHPSVDDQFAVAETLYDEGILSEEDALKKDDIAVLLDERGVVLEYQLRTSLDNLCEIPVAARYLPPGAKYVPISQRRDEVIFGEVEETVQVDQAALLDHIHDDDPVEDEEAPPITADGRGVTVREVIADDAGVDPADVEDHLQSGGRDEQRERLNDAIDAIVNADEVSKRGSYGKVVFRHKAYRYWLI